jgi:RsiW-degrading membrane proteinase PrsW (M82 family)
MYYYHRDTHREPWQWILLVFLAGMMATWCVLPMQLWAQGFRPKPTTLNGHQAPLALFLECLLIPGLMEECAKMLVVVLLVYPRKEFDEPIDGLIYGLTAALGFTFGEDLLYFAIRGSGDWSRALSALAHPWFSCFWASALGWSKFKPRSFGIPLVLGGLLLSTFVHGLYDFLILASVVHQMAWLRHLIAPLMIALYFVLEHHLEVAQAASPMPNAEPAPAEVTPSE